MKKDELVFVHSLLEEVKKELESRGYPKTAELAEYEQNEYSSVHINNRKEYHEDAVKLILDGIIASLEDQASPQKSESSSNTAPETH